MRAGQDEGQDEESDEKMKYILFNKFLDRKLVHPVYGVWTTPELDEAQKMLKVCKQYLMAQGLEDIQNKFVIVEEDSGQEIV